MGRAMDWSDGRMERSPISPPPWPWWGSWTDYCPLRLGWNHGKHSACTSCHQICVWQLNAMPNNLVNSGFPVTPFWCFWQTFQTLFLRHYWLQLIRRAWIFDHDNAPTLHGSVPNVIYFTFSYDCTATQRGVDVSIFRTAKMTRCWSAGPVMYVLRTTGCWG